MNRSKYLAILCIPFGVLISFVSFSSSGQEKAKPQKYDLSVLTEKEEIALVKKMAMLPYEVQAASTDLKPHILAGYARELAETFNQFYRYVSVLNAEPELREARLALVDASRATLANALDLLGIAALEEM